MSRPTRSISRAHPFRKARAAIALALFPLVADAQLFDSRSAGKPWVQRAATKILPEAGPVWKKDNRRESGNERNYWLEFRMKEKARLLGAERARTARILSAVRAKAAAFGAFEPPKRIKTPTADVATGGGGKDVSFPEPEGWPPGTDALSRAAATAKRHVESAATTARDATQSLAETIEGSLPATKNSATKTASVILALLVIFLVPAVFFVLLALGVIKIRKGRGLPLRD